MSQYTNPPYDPSGPPQRLPQSPGVPPHAAVPPTQQQPMYAPQAEAPGATAGLVLGICAIVLNLPIIGFILAWIGFTKSRDARDLCQASPGYYSNAGIAEAGYICSIIGMILGALSTFCLCGYMLFIPMMLAGA